MNRRAFLSGFLAAGVGVAVRQSLLPLPPMPQVIDFDAIGRMCTEALAQSMQQTRESFVARYVHQVYALGYCITDEYTHDIYGMATVIDSQGLPWRKNAHGHWNILEPEDYDYVTRALIQDQSRIGTSASNAGSGASSALQRAEGRTYWNAGPHGFKELRDSALHVLARPLAYEEDIDFQDLDGGGRSSGLSSVYESIGNKVHHGSGFDARQFICDGESSEEGVRIVGFGTGAAEGLQS